MNNILRFKIAKNNIDNFNINTIIIFMLFMMLPRFLYEIVKDYNIENVFYIVFAIFFLPFLYIFIYNIKNKYHKNSLDFILITIYVVIAFISVIYSTNPYKCLVGSFGRKDGFITLIFYYFLYVNSKNIKNPKDVIKIINVFFIYALIGTTYAFIDVYFKETIFTTKAYGHMGYGLSANPNFYGTYMMLFSLIGLYICLFKEHTKFHIISTIIIYIGLLLGESTGPYITFLFMLFMLLIYIIVKRKDLFNKIIIWISIFVSLYAIINYSIIYVNKNLYHIDVDVRSTISGDITNIFEVITRKVFDLPDETVAVTKTIDFISSNRITLWQDVLKRTISDNKLLLGYGPDNLSIYHLIETNKEGFSMYNIDKAHNVYLNILAETGIFSLIIYMAWMIVVQIKSFNSKNNLVYLLLFGIIGYNIQAIFNINVIYVMPYYYIITGMMMGLIEGDKDETRIY